MRISTFGFCMRCVTFVTLLIVTNARKPAKTRNANCNFSRNCLSNYRKHVSIIQVNRSIHSANCWEQARQVFVILMPGIYREFYQKVFHCMMQNFCTLPRNLLLYSLNTIRDISYGSNGETQ